MIPVIGSVAMGICTGALYWAAGRIGRDRTSVTAPAR
jgi:hypothetical protein